jgi:uncharacterized protein
MDCFMTTQSKGTRRIAFAIAVGLALTAAAGQAVETAKAPDLDADPHLVAWWKFAETSGTSAADSSGKRHQGVLERGAAFEAASAPGGTGKGITLDGKAGCVRIAGYKGVTGPHPRTVAAWMKTAKATGQILSWGLDDHGQMWNFGFVRGRIGMTPKGGYLYMKAALNDDIWHHVAVVVEEASPPNLHDHVRLFADGEPAVIHDIGLLDLWPIETGDKLDVVVGRGVNGSLADVRIYDRPLSEDEIKILFKKGIPK